MSKNVLGNLDKGLLFIVSAPAGTGKSTLVEMICEEFPDFVGESCSCTTRKPRPGEVEGHHYHFLSIEEFEAKIKAGDFLEYATVFGNYYGTEKKEVENLQQQGKHVFLVIDTQGAAQVKENNLEACFIFISPPSLEELRRRLFKRKTESEEKMEERLAWAEEELKVAKLYDYHIVNENLEITYEVLKSILIAEEHKSVF